MKYLFVIVFVTLSFLCKAQYNLVPNPSFEIYSNCPTSSNQLSYASGWINPTTAGTPDYYNSCSSIVGVPSYCNCSSVFQYPNTGNAYCGIWGFNSVSNSREYLQIQLSNPLINGKCYMVSFYANVINWSGYSCNNLGVYLSPSPISSNTSLLLNYNSQIKYFKNQIICDTLNWINIVGLFTSLGGENFITIGNFNDDMSTDTITFNSTSSYGAYFNIDDVSVIPIDSIIGGIPANAGIDKNIALGDSVFIGQEISNLNCNWFELSSNTQIATNISGVYVKPNVTTSYVVEQNLCGNITYDTIKVNVTPTGIKQSVEMQNSISVYPNPSNGVFDLMLINQLLLQNNQYKIIITDVLGEVIKEIGLKSNKLTVDLQEYKNGVYFIQLFNNNRYITTKKIIKQ